MLVTDAFISGSLRQAAFRLEKEFRLIDGPDGEVRVPNKNDLQFFFRNAASLVPATENGEPISLSMLRSKLRTEEKFFSALDGLLVGMDPDFSDDLRIRSIRMAEKIIADEIEIERRVRRRILVPVDPAHWDPRGARIIAERFMQEHTTRLYAALSDGTVDRIMAAIWDAVVARLGPGIEGAKAVQTIQRSGLIGALARQLHEDNSLSLVMFRKSEFDDLSIVDPAGQILAAIVRTFDTQQGLPTRDLDDSENVLSTPTNNRVDPVRLALDDAISQLKEKRRARANWDPIELEKIRREIDWIGSRLHLGQITQAESGLTSLIRHQTPRSKLSDIVKTISSVAEHAREARQYLYAINLLELTIEFNLADSAAWCLYAETLRELGRFDDALTAYETAISQFSYNPFAYAGYAETLRDLGRFDDALAAYDDAISKYRDDAVAHNGRAETLRDLRRFDDALAAYDAALNQFPDDAFARAGRAETLRDLGRFEDALAVYEAATNHFPDDAVARTGRAETLRDLGRFEEALAAYEDAITQFPDNAFARNGRAETFRDLGRFDDALVAYDATISQFPSNVVARNGRAETLRNLSRFDDALAIYEAAISQFSYNPFAYTGYAETLRDLGRLDDALAAYDAAISQFPYNGFARTGRAETLRDLGRFDEALAAYDAAISQFPNNAVARTGRAETLRDLGCFDEALAAYDAAISQFPYNAVARTARAETLRDLGRFDEALAAYDEAISQFPYNAVARTGRAETLRDLGRFDEALVAYDAAISQFPYNTIVRTGRANVLGILGRVDEVEDAIGAQAKNPKTSSDWIALHIVGMANLRAGRIEEARCHIERGSTLCPFLEHQQYFKIAFAFLRLTEQDDSNALADLSAIVEQGTLSPPVKRNVVLLQAHALARGGKTQQARELIFDAKILDFAAERQKRLAQCLNERFNLDDQHHPEGTDTLDLDERIRSLEFHLIDLPQAA